VNQEFMGDKHKNQTPFNLNMPNGRGINKQQAFTNYTKSLDEALRELVESQDAQFPLTIPTNK
jgi:hypothetical protein